MMTGRLVIFSIFSIFPLCRIAAEREVCYEEHLKNGRTECRIVEGDFFFNSSNICDKNQMRHVEQINGFVHFDSIQQEDPMHCLPNLRFIKTIDSNKWSLQFENMPNMNKLSLNDTLVIYNKDNMLIKLDAPNFLMDAEQYGNITSRFKPHRVELQNFMKRGEYNRLDNEAIEYLSDLDEYDVIRGNLVLNESLQSTRTSTKVYAIEGCVVIKNTSLIYENIAFLGRLRKVKCPQGLSTIEDNPKLCVPSAFAERFAGIHHGLNEAQKKKLATLLKTKNGLSAECDGVCYADELAGEEKTDCITIRGDLHLRESIMPKLLEVKRLEGRLIVDGFGGSDFFEAVPKLETIISSSKTEPAILVSHNFKLTRVAFPKNFSIKSQAATTVVIKDNFFYRMDKKQYDKIADKFGKEQIEVDYLKDEECYFGNPIENITDLDNCKTIYGDVELFGDVGKDTSGRPRLITGCVRVHNTTLKFLSFLSRIGPDSSQNCSRGHELTENKNLCVEPWVKKLTITNFNKGGQRLVVFNNKPHCTKTCSRYDMYGGPECVMLEEGFSMPLDDHRMKAVVPSLINLETVSGPIRIRRTNIVRLDVFNTLTTIILSNDEPAIDISDNKHLEHVEFPQLKEISCNSKNSTLIRIRNNGNFMFTVREYNALVAKWGQERVDVDHKEDPSYELGIVVGMGFAAIAAILILIIVLFVAVGIWSRRKYKKQEEENEKEEEKPLLEEYEEKKDENNNKKEEMRPMEEGNSMRISAVKAEDVKNSVVPTEVSKAPTEHPTTLQSTTKNPSTAK